MELRLTWSACAAGRDPQALPGLRRTRHAHGQRRIARPARRYLSSGRIDRVGAALSYQAPKPGRSFQLAPGTVARPAVNTVRPSIPFDGRRFRGRT